MLIDRYGDQAQDVAASRVEALVSEGDALGAAVWRMIACHLRANYRCTSRH
jgi:hypothetical protein